MGTGCYDENGKCVNCKGFHPCVCEQESQDAQELNEHFGVTEGGY